MKKSVVFAALLLCVALVLPSYGRTHTFEYDSSVSAARNRAAEYAYKILNYEWYANEKILRYNGSGYDSKETTGTIHGVPYNVSGGYSFTDYVALPLSKKEETNGKRMKYGMVCASLVTDCIRQGFSSSYNLPLWHICLFHKIGNWKKYISSVSDNIWQTSHPTASSWQNIWANIDWSQRNSGYPAYQKLKRGDYLDNWDHVVLVIDNTSSSQTMTCIDQTTCSRIYETDRVGTRIRYDVKYSELASEKYVPMYVKYPEDEAPQSVNSSLPRITVARVPRTAYVGQPYSGYIKAEGPGVISFSANATALANGISIDENTGIISGTPIAPRNNVTFKFTAENFAGSDTKEFTVTIKGTSAGPRITTLSIPTLTKGTYYSSYGRTIPIRAEGGTLPLTWSVVGGSLPYGMRLGYSTSGTTAYLLGRPSAIGRYSFVLRVLDQNGLYSTRKFNAIVQSRSIFSSSLVMEEDDAKLCVADDDVLEVHEGRDSDIVLVRAGKPLTFNVSGIQEAENLVVYVNDLPLQNVFVSSEGTFTVPADMTQDDLKVSVKDGMDFDEEIFITVSAQ